MKCLLALVFLACALPAGGAQFEEDFTVEPTGWKEFGDPSLFAWDEPNQVLNVTWDSSKTNSYFYYELPFYLTRNDSFSVRLKLRLSFLEIGTTPGKPYTFPFAFGFINTTNSFSPQFFRGSGINPSSGPRNLVEFAYFPDSGFGATVAPTIATEQNQMYYSHNHPLEMVLEDEFEIEMNFDPSVQTLFTTMTRNGEPFGIPPQNSLAPLVFPETTSDVVLNAFAISSYNDGAQSPPQFAGSILARGTIDQVRLAWPDPPVLNVAIARIASGIELAFQGEIGWTYLVQRSADLGLWSDFKEIQTTATGMIQVTDTTSGTAYTFYRVTARRTITR